MAIISVVKSRMAENIHSWYKWRMSQVGSLTTTTNTAVAKTSLKKQFHAGNVN